MIEDLLDLAYIAGIIDGEGCITIKRSKRKYRNNKIGYEPCIGIKMTDLAPLELIQKYFGGNLNPVKVGERNKPTYNLSLTWHMAENLAKNILPYLRVKQIQAKIIIEFFTNIVRLNNGNEIDRRENLYQRITKLNSGKKSEE
jgi:hypothetical protein